MTKITKYFLPVTFESKYKDSLPSLDELPEIPKTRTSVCRFNNLFNKKQA